MSETNQDIIDDSNKESQESTEVDDILNDADLNQLSDDDFNKYFNSGALPEGFTKATKEDKLNDKSSDDDDGDDSDDDEIVNKDSDIGTSNTENVADDKHIAATKNKEENTSKQNKPVDIAKNTPSEDTESILTNDSKNQDKIPTNTAIDYQKAYNDLLAPIKATGKTIGNLTAEELRQLASMGIDYTKKMQTIKPMRKIVETLEAAGIDEQQLNFLIDIKNGNKDAITELLKKNSIDPISLPIEEDSTYTPSNHTVSDDMVEFRMVIDEIKQSPHRDKVNDILNNKWDNSSKMELLASTDLMKGLLVEINEGRFDQIQDEVERQRLFNSANTKNKSDLALYVEIATALQNRQQAQAITHKQSSEHVKKPIDKTVDKTKAAPIKGVFRDSTAKAYKSSDLLNMSDEEFSKLNLDKLT